MLTLFTWIKSYASIALLIFAAAGWGAAGIEKMRISSLKLEAAQTAQKAATARAEQEATARIASETYRVLEARWSQQKQEIEDAHTKQIKDRDDALSSNRTELARLRVAITSAASRGTATSPASAASEPDGAATGTGALLGECAGLLVEGSDSADRLSDQVRGLQAFEAVR